MRVILDTNVLISAIAFESGRPGQLLQAWHERKFNLVAAEELIEEVRRVSRYPHLISRFVPSKVGRLVSDLRDVSVFLTNLPNVDLSPDPFDNFLLAMAQKGEADYLVTGDKADLLALGSHGATRIVSVRQFADLLGL